MRPAPLTRRRIASRSSGLTLIELIAALVLATALAAALIGVLQSMHRHERAMLNSESPVAWSDQLRSRLQWDFVNSRRVHVQPHQLVLIGFASRDFFTGTATHRPAEVVYRIERIRDVSWLVRTERHVDEKTNRNTRSELMASNVSRLDVVRIGNGDDELRSAPGSGGFFTIPPAVRCTITSSTGSRLTECVVIRSRRGS